jgi:hypothetical protein
MNWNIYTIFIKKKEKKDFRPGFISEIEKEIKSLMVIVDIITHYNCINHFSGKHQGPVVQNTG